VRFAFHKKEESAGFCGDFACRVSNDRRSLYNQTQFVMLMRVPADCIIAYYDAGRHPEES
jgi:hypothetical protein